MEYEINTCALMQLFCGNILRLRSLKQVSYVLWLLLLPNYHIATHLYIELIITQNIRKIVYIVKYLINIYIYI